MSTALSCQSDQESSRSASVPLDQMTPSAHAMTLEEGVLGIDFEGFFPEGIARSEGGDFYIGSVNTGSIVIVKNGQQWAETFIDGERLQGAGTAGLAVDSANNILYACTGDFFGRIPSQIWQFDLQTGETQKKYPFPGRSFCNDLTLDNQGTVYATDSFGGRIFRIYDQNLEVWLEGDVYQPKMNSPLSLNGITWDPQGKIWFGRSDTGQISSVVIKEDGTAGEVQLDQLPLFDDERVQSIDGLKWRSDGELIAIRGRAVYQLTRMSDHTDVNEDHWEVKLIDDTLKHATTFAFDDQRTSAWVVESQLSSFYQGQAPLMPFNVRQVQLPQ